MNARTALPYLSAARAAAIDRDVAQGFAARWRERSRARLSLEPAPALHEPLRQSLDAVLEARADGWPFSWACSQQQKIAALDRGVIAAAGGLV